MNAGVREFALAPVPQQTWLFLAAIAAMLLVGGLLLPRSQPLPAPAWLVVPFFVALLLVVPLLALRRRRIAIEGDELVVAASIYTRRVRVDALDLDRARIVDPGEHTGFKPMLGLNRVGVPGLHAGHYLLRNRRRAFCLLTAGSRALALPQRDGKLLLLGPEKPRELLERLRELAAAQPRR